MTLFRAGCCADCTALGVCPTKSHSRATSSLMCYLSQVQCQQICFVLEMTHCSLLCCNLQLPFPALSHHSLPVCTRQGVTVCKQLCRRSHEKCGGKHTSSIAVLPIATRLLERSRRSVQVDSMLFSRCWRYLNKGREQKVLLTGEQHTKHKLPLPSSGEGTSTSREKFNLELGALGWHGTLQSRFQQ